MKGIWMLAAMFYSKIDYVDGGANLFSEKKKIELPQNRGEMWL